MAIQRKKCGVCKFLTTNGNPMGKFGICQSCHRLNAQYQGYAARSRKGLGPTKKPDWLDAQQFATYWLEFMEGWLDCASKCRRGPWGHVALGQRTLSQQSGQVEYERVNGYERELQYLPEKPAKQQFRHWRS